MPFMGVFEREESVNYWGGMENTMDQGKNTMLAVSVYECSPFPGTINTS